MSCVLCALVRKGPGSRSRVGDPGTWIQCVPHCLIFCLEKLVISDFTDFYSHKNPVGKYMEESSSILISNYLDVVSVSGVLDFVQLNTDEVCSVFRRFIHGS
jgi:hypothetical protein